MPCFARPIAPDKRCSQQLVRSWPIACLRLSLSLSFIGGYAAPRQLRLRSIFNALRQFYLFTDTTNIIHFRFERPNISLRIIFKALTIGLPQFLINFCACLVAIIITRSMTLYGAETGAGGDIAVGSYGIANRLILFAVMLVIGLNQGMQPIAGFNYGAQRYDRLIEVLKKAGLFATVISVASFCIFFFFATPLVTLLQRFAATD